MIDLPVMTTSQKTSKKKKTMEDEEIISIRAENEKYIQEAAFYKTKTMYINLKNQKNRTNCL